MRFLSRRQCGGCLNAGGWLALPDIWIALASKKCDELTYVVGAAEGRHRGRAKWIGTFMPLYDPTSACLSDYWLSDIARA